MNSTLPSAIQTVQRRWYHAAFAAAVAAAVVLVGAATAPAAPQEVNDAHIGIPALAPQIPTGVEPYSGSPKKGTCTAGIVDKPCVQDSECGGGGSCSVTSAYDPAFDEIAPGSPPPIFRPTDLITLDGEIFRSVTPAATNFGLTWWDMRLDSALNAYNYGQPRPRTDGFPTNGRQLGCAGLLFNQPVNRCRFEPNPAAYLYYFDNNSACGIGPPTSSLGNTQDLDCNVASSECTMVGPNSFLDASQLPLGPDGVSTLGEHSITVAAQMDVNSINDCFPKIRRFPFVIAVPTLGLPKRGNHKLDVQFSGPCPVGGEPNDCYKKVTISGDVDFRKADNDLGNVGDPPPSDGTPAEFGQGFTTSIPAHVRLTIGDTIVDDHFDVSIKKKGTIKERWDLDKKSALSGRLTVKKMQILFRGSKGTRFKFKSQADGLETSDVRFDSVDPNVELTITFGTLPGLATGQVVLSTSRVEFDQLGAKRWRRKQSGNKMQKKDLPDCEDNGGILQVDCPAPPNPSAPMDPSVPQPAMDFTAWNTFIAMNWPALEPTPENDYQRGFPDLSKSFKNASNTDMTVWETFKSKAEVFHAPQQTATPVVGWNEPPAYGNPRETYGGIAPDTPPTGTSGANFPVCPGATAPGQDTSYHRLDGTLQVRTEARESQEALCNGGAENPRDPLPPAPVACDGSPTQPACCEVGYLDDGVSWPPRSGRPVYARVWKGSPNDPTPRMLVYEVKLNHDSFKFLTNPGERYDIDSCASDASSGSLANLPWRSDQPLPPRFLPGSPVFGAENGGPLGYSAKACLANYQDANDDRAFDTTPCPVGSIHIKSAWIPLTHNGVELEPADDYHTRPGIVFRTIDDPSIGEYTCVAAETFGLVGLHVTQRTRQRGGAMGGTWLFSTFEHVSNGDYQNAPTVSPYRYANWWRNENQLSPEDPPAPSDPALTPVLAALTSPGEWVPPLSTGGIEVMRGNELPQSTIDANAAVHDALGCGGGGPVWCNYHLTGIQWQPVDALGNQVLDDTIANPDSNDPTGIDQQFWLANLVIETNTSSQFWHGQPPRQNVINRYYDPFRVQPPLDSGVFSWSPPLRLASKGFDLNSKPLHPNCDPADPLSPTPDTFRAENKNLAFQKRAFNMGGCIGCHANSQVEGFAFSFTAANGQRGSIAPATDSPTPPVEALTPAINRGATSCDETVLHPDYATCPLTAQP